MKTRKIEIELDSPTLAEDVLLTVENCRHGDSRHNQVLARTFSLDSGEEIGEGRFYHIRRGGDLVLGQHVATEILSRVGGRFSRDDVEDLGILLSRLVPRD